MTTQARFAPGQILGGRYRVVGLLGRGGMGEVYRAQDMTLGVEVALKLLPAGLAADQVRLQRFLGEVRTTRLVSHPSVCRVFDIAEAPDPAAAPGQPSAALWFISMEYVDGEDLASLIRRIGRLPPDKAIEVARQICAGLAAAHEQGIVHRDLKPANIMLDGRGRVRVMDFGVAGVAEVLTARGEVMAGTPAYMAPEQLAGQSVSVRSDLYALGLVLYEAFTGKPAWEGRGRTIAELRTLHDSSGPASPGTLVADMDPLVERAIMRCLERDPAMRPASALAVAAALPGGDPVAAALAAGETPSPEMVAASGSVGALSPRLAGVLLMMLVICMVGAVLISERSTLFNLSAPPLEPEVLASKCRDVVRALGYAPAPSEEYGFYPNDLGVAFMERWAKGSDAGALPAVPKDRNWWSHLGDERFPAMLFFYRQSPDRLMPRRLESMRVEFDDPSMVEATSARVVVDSQGRLVRFEGIPAVTSQPWAGAKEGAPGATTRSSPGSPESAGNAEPHASVDWSSVFGLAGLEMAAFRPVEPRWPPLTWADARVAWEGVLPTDPPMPARVEGASDGGTVVSFRLLHEWSEHDRKVADLARPVGARVAEFVGAALFLSAIVGGAFLAWRNIRSGRYDRRGATALLLVVLILTWISRAIAPTRISSVLSIESLDRPLAAAMWLAGIGWMSYAALEPIVRRLWPNLLVAWTRLLAGRWRDPLVGREILVGAAVGVPIHLATLLATIAPKWFGAVPPAPMHTSDPTSLVGARALTSTILAALTASITVAMLFVLLLVGIRALIRSSRWAVVVVIFILSGVEIAGRQAGVIALTAEVIGNTIIVLTLVRGGLLAGIVMFACVAVLGSVPLSSSTSDWWAPATWTVVGGILAACVFGASTAVAGRRAAHPLS